MPGLNRRRVEGIHRSTMGKKDGKKRSRAGSGGEGGSKRSKAPPGLPSAKDIAAAAASTRGRALEQDGGGHAKSAAPASSSSSSSSSSASGSSSSSSSSSKAGGLTTTTKAARDVSKTGWNAPTEGLKSGHWSKTEDAALQQTITDYLENRDGLTLEQLIKQKEHKTSGSGSAPWLDIAASFPLRHVRSVYYRAQRLMNDDNYKGRQAFTAADKEKLKRVVQDVGEKWSLVGIQMGRLGDTVRRQRGREAERQRCREAERQRGREAERRTWDRC